MKTTPEQLAERKSMVGPFSLPSASVSTITLVNLIADLEAAQEVIADHKRLVRELDVILCGESGAAKQASLCDLVGYVKHQLSGLTLAELAATRKQLAEAQAGEARALEDLEHLCENGAKMTAEDFELIGLTLDTRPSGSDALSAAIAEAAVPYKRDAENMRKILRLTEQEGEEVTVLYPNAEPCDPSSQFAIEVSKEFGADPVSYHGESLTVCLNAALAAKEAKQ